MEFEKKLEGKTDNLEDTSASDTTVVEETENPVQPEEGNNIPDLTNSPAPTQDEVEAANVNVQPENIVPNEGEDNPVQSDQPVMSETVTAEEDITSVNPEAESQPDLVKEENGATDFPATKCFTQSQVNEMMGGCRTETREKTFKYIYDRYGVKDEAELDEVVGNAQRFESLQEEYANEKKAWGESDKTRNQQLADLSEQVALMQSGIDSARYDDAKFILKGKGLPVTIENITNELASHPEWNKSNAQENANPNFVKDPNANPIAQPQNNEPSSRIDVLGNEGSAKGQSEEDYVFSKYFK